jgi:hypothetical protein
LREVKGDADAMMELQKLDALRGYEAFYKLPAGSATVEQVANSSAGISGYAEYAKVLDVVSVDQKDDAEMAAKLEKQRDQEGKRRSFLTKLGVVEEVERRVRFDLGHDRVRPMQIDGAYDFPVIAPIPLKLCETEETGGDAQVLSAEQWVDVEFEVALDSGSQDHVCDDIDCPGYVTEVSPGSSRGQCFIVGDGNRIANLGQRGLNLQPMSDSNSQLKSVFQIAKVTRPLMSVGKICDNGMQVTFDHDRAVVRDRKDGSELCVFERKAGGLYLCKFRLKAPSPGFGRLG